MSDTTFMGVARGRIPWAPTIDYETCNFCMECYEFCPHRVLERRDGDIPLVVANPENCVVFCRACAKTCVLDAISFPDKAETVALIGRLRAEETRLEHDAAPTAATPTPPSETAFARPVDFVVVTHDKYQFRIPAAGFYFNQNDVWAQVAGRRARIGISDYLQQRLTDITYVDLPPLGTAVEQFGEAGTLESTKAVFEIVSPVTGAVVQVNEALADAPEAINADPYGSWIAELELTAWESDCAVLADASAYAAEVERKAAED